MLLLLTGDGGVTGAPCEPVLVVLMVSVCVHRVRQPERRRWSVANRGGFGISIR
jgi:hypothetical protein